MADSAYSPRQCQRQLPLHCRSSELWKKDLNGQWALLIDRKGPGGTGNLLRIKAPADLATTASLQYRIAGSASWIAVPAAQLVNFGDTLVFDLTPLKEGAYEYQALYQKAGEAATLYDSGAVAVTQPQLRTQLTQLYVALLNRAPDLTGLGYYVKSMQSGLSLAQIAQGMYNSPEAQTAALYKGLGATGFVQKFYQLALGRTIGLNEAGVLNDATAAAWAARRRSSSPGRVPGCAPPT